MKYFVLTLSDKASRGERRYKWKSHPGINKKINGKLIDYKILPDDKKLIEKELKNLVEKDVEVVITTGGTGLTPRDVPPEATLKVIERRIYGTEIAMIIEALKHTPYGMLLRAIVGVSNKTLIINLPGSPKAVKENLNVLLPVIPYAIEKINGSSTNCVK